jgi:hypothetical protein
MASKHQRDARDEQQREHDFPERCFVNPSKQLEAKQVPPRRQGSPITKNLAVPAVTVPFKPSQSALIRKIATATG